MAVVRKLKRILEERSPPSDKEQLRDEDGIFGVISSASFPRKKLPTQLTRTREVGRDWLAIVARRPLFLSLRTLDKNLPV